VTDPCVLNQQFKKWMNDRGDYEFEYEIEHVKDDLTGETDEDLEYAILMMETLLGDEATDENSSMWCDWMLWYTVCTYGLVALIATATVCRGIHTAFIWPTLSTLVMFNVLLKQCNYVKIYLPCIVGGLAWEGAMLWGNDRRALENKYEATLAVVYRDYHRNDNSDLDVYEMSLVTKSFVYEEWIHPFIYIFYPPGVFLLLCLCICQVSGS
jgi:hypothetical protein